LGADGTAPDGSTYFQNVYRRPVQKIWNGQTGARIERGYNLVIYNVSLSQAGQKGGYDRAGFGWTGGNIPYTISTADPFTPQFNTNTNIFDPVMYSLNTNDGGYVELQNTNTFERDVMGEVSYARRYSSSSGSKFGAFEVGLKVDDANKNQVQRTNDYNYLGTGTISDFSGSFNDPNYYMGRYHV
jgi:hypothetical protein